MTFDPKEYQKEYYINHREYWKKYYENSKEYKKKYYQDNKEQITEYQKLYQNKNRDYINWRARNYYMIRKGEKEKADYTFSSGSFTLAFD